MALEPSAVLVETAKAAVLADIDDRADQLIEASRAIHARPELAFEEHHAHDLLTSMLSDAGLDTERGAFDLDTAFQATAGTSGPLVGIMCEYDALPEIGHACGHNIIATAGLGAGLAAAVIAEQFGGRVRILGTPAEEGGGGKVMMAQRGAFDGLDAAMMVHPAGADLTAMNCVAIQQLNIEYLGEAAHAAAAPHLGRNALDAAVLGYMNVAALRQHIRSNERIHGIFTHGGDKPNIVPKYASQFWYIRSGTMASLQPLKDRVLTALQAGAMASGCSCQHTWDQYPYSDMLDNGPLVDAYAANADRLGRLVKEPGDLSKVVGSTDMGNVSYLVPSIHPLIKVSPAHVAIHTPEFERYAGGEDGDKAVVDGAKAMAMTVVDIWLSATLREKAHDEYVVALSKAGA
jgi:amidohydrolase